MRITQMDLEDFGIYHNVTWQPPQSGLIVMHGQNESGKTTLMKYVRSMFFGYPRGEWQGFFGHMSVRRDDGQDGEVVSALGVEGAAGDRFHPVGGIAQRL